jgi:hypothetical protein
MCYFRKLAINNIHIQKFAIACVIYKLANQLISDMKTILGASWATFWIDFCALVSDDLQLVW